MTSCNDCHPLANRPVVTALDLTKLDEPRLDLAARQYIGTPFLHQGRNPDVGVDCIGLLSLSARDCGLHGLVAAHDATDYARNPSQQELESRLRAAFGTAVQGDVRPGDIVSIAFHGQTRHVAIVSEHGERLTLIHAYGRPPRVIEHSLDASWLRRITGIYRVEVAA